MIVEVAAVVTAIATGCSAIYMVISNREERLRRAPAIRIHEITVKDGCALIHVSIYPTDHHIRIYRISSNGAGIQQAPFTVSESGRIKFHPAQNHPPSIEGDLDLLPSHVSSKTLSQHLSVKLRKNQSSVQISFHSSRKRFATKHKVTAMISKQTD